MFWLELLNTKWKIYIAYTHGYPDKSREIQVIMDQNLSMSHTPGNMILIFTFFFFCLIFHMLL